MDYRIHEAIQGSIAERISSLAWQLAFEDLEGADVNRGFELALSSMKIRRRAILEEHPDQDPLEGADCRHSARLILPSGGFVTISRLATGNGCHRDGRYAEVMEVHIRQAEPTDGDQLARLREALWPETLATEHACELEPILAGETPGSMPLVNFVAETADGRLSGFAEVDLRPHADGCNPARPVGYLEGWYEGQA